MIVCTICCTRQKRLSEIIQSCQRLLGYLIHQSSMELELFWVIQSQQGYAPAILNVVHQIYQVCSQDQIYERPIQHLTKFCSQLALKQFCKRPDASLFSLNEYVKVQQSAPAPRCIALCPNAALHAALFVWQERRIYRTTLHSDRCRSLSVTHQLYTMQLRCQKYKGPSCFSPPQPKTFKT